MTKEDVLKFIKIHNLAVVATVGVDNKPQAAVVEYGEFDDLTIIIDLDNTSRKYKNLQTNKNVALVIGWDENITVQLEGEAYELKNDELKKAQESYFAKNPKAKKWANEPSIAYFVIKPNWIRYSDLNQTPWLVKEFNFPG